MPPNPEDNTVHAGQAVAGTTAPEFSRLVPVARIERAPLVRDIAASEAERADLARRFGLEGIDRLEARVTLRRMGRQDIRLDAELSAFVAQACVVTLVPLPVEVDESFTLIYRPGIDDEEADRMAVENPENDVVEPLIGEAIDIGEAVAQQLSVALDPFPRAPDAALPDVVILDDLPFEPSLLENMPDLSDTSADAAEKHPFAVLKGLKKH